MNKAIITPLLISIPIGIATSIIGSIFYNKFFYKIKNGQKKEKQYPINVLWIVNIFSTIYVLFVYYFSFKRWVLSDIYLFFIIIFFILLAAFLNLIFLRIIFSVYSKYSFTIIISALLIFLFTDMYLPHNIKIEIPDKITGSFVLRGWITESEFNVYVFVHPFKINTWYEQPKPTVYKKNWQTRIHLAGGSGDDFEIIALASKEKLDVENILKEAIIPNHIPRHILTVKKE